MNRLRKNEILKILDSEILKIRESAQKTDEASKFTISGPSQSGDKYHSEATAELANEYLKKLALLRKEIDSTPDETNQKVLAPCFLKIEYLDGQIMETLLVENIVSIANLSLISEKSPLGLSVLGKSRGESFSYTLGGGKNFAGKILVVE